MKLFPTSWSEQMETPDKWNVDLRYKTIKKKSMFLEENMGKYLGSWKDLLS